MIRKEVLEHISSPKVLEDMIQVTSPRAWLLLIAVFLILAGIVLWCFFGTIITRVQGVGIFYAEDQVLTDVVAPEGGGYITQLKVRPTDFVTAGETIAIMTNPTLNNDITTSENHLADLVDKYQDLERQANTALATREQKNIDELASVNRELENAIAKKEHLLDLLDKKNAAREKGIISMLNVSDTQIDYYNQEQVIADIQQEIIRLNVAMNDYKESWNSRLEDLKLRIADERARLEKLRGQSKLYQEIISRVTGVISDINVKVGEYVNQRRVIAHIAKQQTGLEAIIYVSAEEGKHVQEGMRAIVYPSNTEKLEHGGIIGYVSYVSQYPATPDRMLKKLKNQSLVNRFMAAGPVLEVQISLIEDENTATGYKWTNSRGPNYDVTPGTLNSAAILIRKQTPISILFPILQSKTYWIVEKD